MYSVPVGHREEDTVVMLGEGGIISFLLEGGASRREGKRGEERIETTGSGWLDTEVYCSSPLRESGRLRSSGWLLVGAVLRTTVGAVRWVTRQ